MTDYSEQNKEELEEELEEEEETLDTNSTEELPETVKEEIKEEPKGKKAKKYVATYVIFSQFVFFIFFLLGGGIWLGVYLDRVCNTKVLFLLLAIFLIGPIPFYNLITRTRK